MQNNHSILVVDDEVQLVAALSAQLVDAGYNVETAYDGEQALAILQKKQFDVILLDVRMPKVNGLEVLKFVTKNSPSTKTIMLTAYDDAKTALDARKFGAYDFVAKPYIFDDLLLKIQNAVKRSASS